MFLSIRGVGGALCKPMSSQVMCPPSQTLLRLPLLSLVQPFKASFPSAPASPADCGSRSVSSASGPGGLSSGSVVLPQAVAVRACHTAQETAAGLFCKHPELVDQPVWQCRDGQSANVMNEIRSKAEWRTGQVRLPVAVSIDSLSRFRQGWVPC